MTIFVTPSKNEAPSGNNAPSDNKADNGIITKQLAEGVSVRYKEKASFNGKKVTFGAEDISLEVNGTVYTGDRLKIKYKNNKKAGEAKFYIRNLKSAPKADRKAVRKIRKTANTFIIEKLTLTTDNTKVILDKKGNVKAVKAVIGKRMRRIKKSEYRVEGKTITFTGDNYQGVITF